MPLRRAQPWLPALLAAALAVLYLVWDPLAPDLAAQVFRTDLFAHDGFGLWNGQWFGGHHTLGYSVLFPPLGAALGPIGARTHGSARCGSPPRPRPTC